MIRLFSLGICLAALVFTSCSKKVLPTSTVKEKYALEKFDFEYLQAKSKISFSSPERSLSSSASIRMKKDSIIWISVSPMFGIEAARGFISTDTIVFMDRVNKDVYRYNFESLSNTLNFEVDFQIIQSILLGNQVFDFQKGDDFSKRPGEIKIGQSRGPFTLETTASAKNRKVFNIKVQEVPDGSMMMILFSDFKIVGEKLFPFNTNVEIISEGSEEEESTVVEINHSKVIVGDDPMSFPFSVPSKYEN